VETERQNEREADLREDADQLEQRGDEMEEKGDRLDKQIDNVRDEFKKRKQETDPSAADEDA
jgi:hypothetical protein